MSHNGKRMDYNHYQSTYKEQFITNQEISLDVFCHDEDSVEDSEEYKLVFSAAESYLNRCSASQLERSPYYALRKFKDIVYKNKKAKIKNTWGSFTSVFFLLNLYALRILRAPWRKSYYKIKTYSGSYHHGIAAHFQQEVVEELMLQLGYIYSSPKQTFFFHQQSLATAQWKDSLMLAGMDFFLVHVRCALDSREMGGRAEVDIPIERPIPVSRFKAYQPQGKDSYTIQGQPLRNFSAPAVVPPNYKSATLPSRSARSSYSEGSIFAVEKPTYDEGRFVPIKDPAPPKIPYGHRMATHAKQSPGMHSAKHTGSTVGRLMSQLSDEHEDIYGSESMIRYPPTDVPFRGVSSFGVETMQRLKRTTGVAATGASSSRGGDWDGNYVSVRPMEKARVASNERSSAHTSSYGGDMYPPPAYFTMLRDKEQVSRPSRPGAGEYVHVRPPKRGSDSKTEDPQHIYQEIQDKDLLSARPLWNQA